MSDHFQVLDAPRNNHDSSSDIQEWEVAYLRFESEQQQRAKFVKRLKSFGVESWDRSLAICELLCGQGNGLNAWQNLGFHNIEGLDISEDLLAVYKGTAKLHVGDARDLPFENDTYNIISIQGGLHHLKLMDDLDRSLHEIHRVLKPGGKLLLTEPWLTPFLQLVHTACETTLCRKMWDKLDALATMIDLERDTYFDWLSQPGPILERLETIVEPQLLRIAWGKLMLLGTKR